MNSLETLKIALNGDLFTLLIYRPSDFYSFQSLRELYVKNKKHVWGKSIHLCVISNLNQSDPWQRMWILTLNLTWQNPS